MSEEGSEPMSEEGSEPMSEEGSEPMNEEGSEPMSEEGSEPMSEEGSEPMSEEGSEPTSEEGSEPMSEEGSEPMSEEESEPMSEEGSEPTSEEGSESSTSLHLPLFSTNLVSTAALQDAMVTTLCRRVSICTCTQTGHHLATFTRRRGLILYTLATEPPQVVASAQVSASGQEAPPCSVAPPPRSPLPATPSWHAPKGALECCEERTALLVQYVLGGRGQVVLTGHANASWADNSATQRSSQGYTFSLGSGSVSWRSTRSSSALSSSCEAEIYAEAMAVQELRWLTYLLTDLGEQPRSPLVLYVDNKIMITFCKEHRLEHRTKHIALRYFLARELQQRGQLHLVYVATMANTADIFTKALPPGDHQRFSTLLGLVPILPDLLTA
ncbi:unnamed protein product [Closterium sp. NIES-54]